MLARLLHISGGDVAVYERDADVRARVNHGATLDLHRDGGLEALRRGGLMDAFWAAYRPGADKLVFVDRDGTPHLDEFASADLGEERPEIDRGPLRTLLLESLPSESIHWDHKFEGLTRRANVIHLQFANGTTVSADLVVAADGAKSAIRQHITDEPPLYSGITAIEGSVSCAEAAPEIARMVGSGKVCALGDSKTLFIGSKGDGSLSFYTGHRAAEDWSRTCGVDFSKRRSVLGWFHAEFAGWSPIWDALFEQAEPKFVPRPQYYCSPDQHWAPLPNLTMLGDAAHVMPPYAGEGVNLAMQDAYELAECLLDRETSNTAGAIAKYERAMRSRAATRTHMTLENTEAFHSPNALEHFVAMFEGFAAASRAAH